MAIKNEILRKLRESGDYVSGQELCTDLGVSRTAVWKAIKALQGDGYEIEAVQGRGYRVIGFPDTIAEEEVQSLLRTERMGKNIRYFQVIDSTNNYAKRVAEAGAPEGTLIIGDEQTAGKGRSGRVWKTPPGCAIAFTLVLRPDLPLNRISMVTLVMGMAVAEAFRKLYSMDVGIKWPNDVVTRGRKLCGILTEMSAEMERICYLVVGVGINANVKEFPDDLKETATSAAIELGHDVNRAELIAEVMACFERDYDKFLASGDLSNLQETYNSMLLNKDRAVRVLEPGHEYSGTALGIDIDGELLVRRDDTSEVVKVYAGEVSVRGIYGYV